jgi:hypothetical protein
MVPLNRLLFLQRTDNKREKLADFVHGYLKRRFAMEQMVVEWGYNLHDACQRYSHDENIGLFWNILSEEVREKELLQLCCASAYFKITKFTCST